MAAMADPNPKLISPPELDAVLEQARVEGWRELALLGPGSVQLRSGAPEAHTFHLSEPLGTRIARLPSLTGLTSLDLKLNKIGDEGARVLAALTGLTSLRLGYNPIGDEGVRALAGLTSVTL